ncbi:Envelope fusion protein [Aphis craccivora]|uniref:Envelope fusion protein n=1 Tax=Aphis craccivora TaxID=307492 RepID=A0A6G0ZBD2_APHCR|nr:Envelope fusion protein [Aphis craccivora]
MSALDEQITKELSSKSIDKIKMVHSIGLSTNNKIKEKKHKNKPTKTMKVIYNSESNQFQVQDNTETVEK